MNLEEIKEIIRKSGGKFIIVENGKPEMVIMSFEDFKRDLEESKTSISGARAKDEIIDSPKEKPELPEELEEEPLKIEDLPF
jgi:PHD/YefM family antitoxin component YafN of YafNO toxin-antitoxin module